MTESMSMLMSDPCHIIQFIPLGQAFSKTTGIRLFVVAVFVVVTVTWARKAITAVRSGVILAGSKGTATTFNRDRQPVRFWLNVTVAWLVVVIGIASILVLIFMHFDSH
jgi:hypothetical protein